MCIIKTCRKHIMIENELIKSNSVYYTASNVTVNL